MPYRRHETNAHPASSRNAIGAPTRPSDGVDLPSRLEACRVLGCRGGIDPLEGDVERPVEVGRSQERQHVVLVDRLALGVGQEGRLEAGCRIELDLPVLERGVDIEEDREAIIEPAPSDAPLVDERAGAGIGLLGRDAVVDELRVDDDLGRRALLDRVDRRLGVLDARRGQDAGVVVDGLPLDGIREWRASGRRGRDRERQDRRDGDRADDRAAETAAKAAKADETDRVDQAETLAAA